MKFIWGIWGFLFLCLSGCETGDHIQLPSTNTATNSSESSPASVPLSADAWDVVTTGYGEVNFDNGITITPKIPTDGDVHSALLLLKQTETCPVKDFALTVHATTVKQFQSTPEPWEVFWIFFNYRPLAELAAPGAPEALYRTQPDGKITNYFIEKTNGIELGTAYGEFGQNFLKTLSSPQLKLGDETEYAIRFEKGALTVAINGVPALTYPAAGETSLLEIDPGSIGLYAEDSLVLVKKVGFTSLDETPCP